ncbi:hypothetical protein [Bradyrhizobium sp. CER78]|uniref:hypothetical protein n=1 Tax=Bradyrhizobium sp. CER78 TaxID=3039162 RepID=UPI00244D05F5|nr:hypothetical protein [Bradyrhizobium sp. CER78]MDH2380755.1 hypothetical protein [Bradyrhizobium sp. CER78]
MIGMAALPVATAELVADLAATSRGLAARYVAQMNIANAIKNGCESTVEAGRSTIFGENLGVVMPTALPHVVELGI